MRVVGPIGSELKFHGYASGNPHGEIDAEQFPPELRRITPDFPSCHHVHAFHDGKQERQPKRQRHKQEMIEGRYSKLWSRKADGVQLEHVNVSSHSQTTPTDLSAARPRSSRRPAARCSKIGKRRHPRLRSA